MAETATKATLKSTLKRGNTEIRESRANRELLGKRPKAYFKAELDKDNKFVLLNEVKQQDW